MFTLVVSGFDYLNKATKVRNFYFLVLVLVGSFLLISCGAKNSANGDQLRNSQYEPLLVQNPSKLRDEEYSALLGVVNDGNIVLTDETEPSAGRIGKSSLAKQFPSLSADTIEDFKRVNDKAYSVECRFPKDRKCALLTAEDLRSLWDFKNGGNATLKWKEFRVRYGTDRYFTVSRVGFNEDRTQALVFAIGTCGTLCRDFTYYHLVKDDGGWKVVKRLLTGAE